MLSCASTDLVWGVMVQVLNGFKLAAKAVYANVPQIKLLGSTYSELGMKKYFEAALDNHLKKSTMILISLSNHKIMYALTIFYM